VRTFATFLLAVAPLVTAQDRTLNAVTIALSLNRPPTQWVFNHICVPERLLEGQGFTRGEFADAYLVVSQMRWEAALEALGKGDEKESMKSLALILHGIIDAYWPGRVERDSDGAITKFRDCDELGDLQGVLREERSGSGPTGATKEQVTQLMSEVIRKWKERKQFEEVRPLLSGGPMKINASASMQPLTQK
jgi:hypothetical protein